MDSNEMFLLLSQFQWPDQDEASPLQFAQPVISSEPHLAKQSNDHISLSHEEHVYHSLGEPGAILNNNEWVHGVFPPPQPLQSGAALPSSRQTSQRNKYGYLDWDTHRETLKRLYVTENKTLSETMRIMKDSYGFNASTKLYKDRFRQWNWSKNLPTDVAVFMAAKLKCRQESGLETIFTYGEREWDKDRVESTLRRSKKQRVDENPLDIGTPEGVTYGTPLPSPADNAESPHSRFSTVKESVIEGNIDFPSDDQPPSLTWNGMTRTDVLRIWESSRAAAANGQARAAIRMLTQALEGMRHLNGVIQEISNKIGYELATLHFQQGSQKEADAVLDEITRLHFQKLGSQHNRTQQHILTSVELLESWDRHDDALGLLYHSEEILQYRGGVQRPESNLKDTDPGNDPAPVSSHLFPGSGNGSFSSPNNDTRVDQSPGITYCNVDVNNKAVEKLLLRIIQDCEKSPHHLNLQYLQAYRDLLSLYRKMGEIDSHQPILHLAGVAITTVLDQCLRDEQQPGSFAIIESCLLTIAILMQCGFESTQLLQKLVKKVDKFYERNDERFIWMFICIGAIHQTYGSWKDAEYYFLYAYNRALGSARGNLHPALASLGMALRTGSFSFFNSFESSPFRIAFGVPGITILPVALDVEC